MAEEWEELEGAWQRLRWARTQWQTKSGAGSTAKDAAESIGIPVSTYNQYERAPGTSRTAELTEQYAHRFARKYKVDWAWLLTGRGHPFATSDPDQERIYLAMARASDEDRERIAKMIDLIVDKKQNTAS